MTTILCGKSFHKATQTAWRTGIRPSVIREIASIPKQTLQHTRNDIISQIRLNHTLINVHQNFLQHVRNLRGQRLRQFRAYLKQLQQDFRLWAGEEKPPEGFGKFFPKKNNQKNVENNNKQPSQNSSQSSKDRGQQIEFKFSFGSGKGGGGAGGKNPIDPNMWTMLGFFGTLSVLMAVSTMKMRFVF